eukprot:Sspe_Gene.20320::Locus_7448_Transcript_1_1_Confidence_1.000_Length_2122::g.20320::m.20320
MATLDDVEERVAKITGDIPESEVLRLIEETENHARFFNNGNYNPKVLQSFIDLLVQQLNSKTLHVHTKSRLLLAINNCSLYKQSREVIMNSIRNVDTTMEHSMKEEGMMPFDSELGRMSEHMLVLLCRVSNYKMKAAQVLEFAEGNVQFAVQLLLAILLKEPAYEFELRVNCMTALLGFSSPTAFFSSDEGAIKERALTEFEAKINNICRLTKRLLVVQVVAEAISPFIAQEGNITNVVHVACISMMKFITNIFNYATQNATAFRQHILTYTTFVDQVVLPYVCKLIIQVAQCFEMHQQKMQVTTAFNPLNPPVKPSSSLPPEVIQGLLTSFRFLSLVTFHMGAHGRNLRFMNSITYDLLRLPTDEFIGKNIKIYAALLQFNCNIDSLADEDAQAEHMPVECRSESLKAAISNVAKALPLPNLLALQQEFNRSQDTMLARDVASYSQIEDLLNAAISNHDQPAAAAGGADTGEYRLFGDLPDPNLGPRKVEKATGEQLENAATVQNDDNLVVPKKMIDNTQPNNADDTPAKFRCALNGHLIKDPVVSPYGHVYERDTIEQWLAKMGSTCPFTGKPLGKDDLKRDDALAIEIANWHIKEQMKTNVEDELDLYDF